MADRRVRVRVEALMGDFNKGMLSGAASASAFANRLDAADSRLAGIVQTALALTPALVPLGAAAIPAIAGLTTQLGFAGVAAGVTALAFNGMGTALTALEAYRLDPTAANLEKVKVALEELAPAGVEFALTLQRLRPQIQELQDLSAQGLFPGATEGLEDILTLAPQVERIVFTTATTLGDLLAEAGDNLADPRWEDFFNYLETSARPVLLDLGRTVGNLGEAFANTVMAFDPASMDFSAGLLDFSRDLAAATARMDESEGFQELLSYIEENGPRAVDTLGAVGGALLQLVEAAAPVGEVALPAIEAVADGIAAVADSSVGPLLIGTAAAVGVLGRSLALLKTVGLTGGNGQSFLHSNYVAPSKGMVAAFRDVTAASTALREAETARAAAAQRAATAQSALIPARDRRAAVSDYTAALAAQTDAEKRLATATASRSTAIRDSAVSAGKGVAAVSGLLLATSDLGDKMGLSNTASLALMGTIAGPWGAAIGGGVGAVMDFAASNNDLESAMAAVNREASAAVINFEAQRTKLAQLAADQKKTQAGLSNPDEGFFFNPLKNLDFGQTLRDVREAFGGAAEEAGAAVDKQLSALERLRTGAAQVYADLNNGSRDMFGATDAELTAFTNRITPALQRAGISVREFLSAADGSQIRTDGLQAITRYFDEMTSASGRSKAIGEALADIGNAAGAAVDPVEALTGALDTLLAPNLNLSEATDAYTESLRSLGDAVRESNGQLRGQSKAALASRDAIRGSVSALQERFNAEAEAGASGAKLVSTLTRGRDAIIDQAVAAGASRREVRRYIDTLGLTPANLTTIIETSGVLSATQKVQALARAYNLTPKEARTVIKAVGAEPTMATIRRVAKQYGLTPKQVMTFLRATDQASAKTIAAKKRAVDFAKSKYQAALQARDDASAKTRAAKQKALDFARSKYQAALRALDQASGVARAARGAALAFQGTYTARFITERQVVNIPAITKPRGSQQAAGGFHERGVQTYADGGYTSTGVYVPRVPQLRRGGDVLWSEGELPWEAYISGKPSMRDRNLEILRMAGEKLGATVTYARGGIRDEVAPAHRVTTTGGRTTVAGIDYDRLAAAVSKGLVVQFNAPVNGTDANDLARQVADRVATAAVLTGVGP